MNFLEIKDSDRILIIAPHPDDEVIGPGGLLAMYPAQCHVIVMTDGSLGDNSIAPYKVREMRRMELIAEADMLPDASFEYWDYEDGKLCNYPNALDKVDFHRYTKVFVTSEMDEHPDHLAAYQSVIKAVIQQEAKHIEVYAYEVHAPLTEANTILDITDVINLKKELINCHKSQVGRFPYQEMMVALAVYRGYQLNLCGRYVEAYRKCDIFAREIVGAAVINLQKFKLFYDVLVRWLECQQSEKTIAQKLKLRGYKSVVIYGYAELGRLLKNDLLKSEISLLYILDKGNKGCIDFPIYKPSKGLEKPDVVVVTAVYYYDEIRCELMNWGYENIISLHELISC